MAIIHQQECLDEQDRWKKDQNQFEEGHPHYCRSCGGWGGKFYSYDPSPSGISLSSGTMEEFDPCPACMENYLCPHCKTPTVPTGTRYHEHQLCLKCGWDENKPSGMPERPECFCFLSEID